MDTPYELAKSIIENPHTWPGCYERFAITDDGAALCWQCTTANLDEIAESTIGDGWHVVGTDNIGNVDVPPYGPDIWCGHCWRSIGIEPIDNRFTVEAHERKFAAKGDNPTHPVNLGWDARMLENRRGKMFGTWTTQKLTRMLRQIRAEGLAAGMHAAPDSVYSAIRYLSDSEV